MRYLLLTIGAIATCVLYWHIGLLAVLVYVWAAAMASTANTAKARSTEARVAALASSAATTNVAVAATSTTVATVTSQAGSGSTFGQSVASLPSPNTSDPQTDATVVTTSGNYNGGTLSSHNHSYGHTHTTGMDPYWDTMATSFNSLVSQLNTQLAQLKSAGLL